MTKKIKTGDIQAGAVSIGGDASSQGNVVNVYGGDVAEALHKELRQALEVVAGVEGSIELKREVHDAIIEAQADLNPDKVGYVMKTLRALRQRIGGAASVSADISKILAAIDQLIKYSS